MTSDLTSDLTGAFRGFGGPPAAKGTVHLVGAGPGDLGLLTLRAAVLLSTCDVVAYDRLAPAAALDLAPDHAERICAGRRSGEQGLSRAAVDDLLVSRAQDGLAVVRFKGGDPFVFGRGGEEAEACHAHGVPVEIVAGVTSAVAVPGAAGIPVTHRTVAAGFAVVTGHEDPAKPSGHVDHASLASFPGTLVFLMGVHNIGQVAGELIRHGRDPDTPVALVRWGTTAHQRTVEGTLGTIADEVTRSGLRPPAVAVVGDVVRLRGGISWRERLALMGRRVLVPRTLDRPSVLAARVRALGGEPLEARVLDTELGPAGPLDAAARRLDGRAYGTVVVSSPTAVTALADALERTGLDARALAGTRIVAVGRGARRALADRLAIRADVEAGSLVEVAGRSASTPSRVLVLAQDEGEAAATAALRDRDHEPHVVTAYITRPTARLPGAVEEAVDDDDVHLIAFASSSCATHLARLLDGRPASARVASIGPRTSAAARDAGLPVHAEAATPDLDGLADALVELAGGPRPVRPLLEDTEVTRR